jgi:hypothetical protein
MAWLPSLALEVSANTQARESVDNSLAFAKLVWAEALEGSIETRRSNASFDPSTNKIISEQSDA